MTLKICLIRPGLGILGRKRYRSLACMEPRALSVLASLTPPDVQITAIDDRFEIIPYDTPLDLVAISAGTFQARRAYEIAKNFKKRGTKVILGGFHPSFCPDEASAYADSVAIGEAEGLWQKIVEDCRKSNLKPRYEHNKPPELAGYQIRPAIFEGKKYMPISVIQFGRGCRYSCDFCSVRAFYPGKVRYRPVGEVIREIRAAGRKSVFLVDDNIVSDKEQAKALFRAMIPLKIRWTSQASLDLVDDLELLKLMAESGCQCLIIGLESLDSGNIRQMGKGWARTEEYRRRLAMIRDYGIMVYATFVFGYDNDSPDVFKRTLDFAFEQKFFLANFNHLQPYPGTRLYTRLQSEGRLLRPKWWLDPEYRFGDVVFQPKGMTAEQLQEGGYQTRMAFHSAAGMWRRFWDPKVNIKSFANGLTFLIVNFASGQDIKRKHGLRLGMNPDDIF